jgi:hypothetical protein
MNNKIPATVERIQESAFRYFDRQCHSATGLIFDSSTPGSHASIAGSGMALASYVVAAERGYLTRGEAARRTHLALKFLATSDQGSAGRGAGLNGFFYHFLEPDTGVRAGRCEISTIDSTILFAGCLTAAAFFDRDDPVEQEIRQLGNSIFLNADWTWASPRPPVVSHGWTPERGFLRYDWRGYNEALLLYILALGSPTYPVPEEAYDEWLVSYKWKSVYGQQLVYGGPLFIHHSAHSWIDFRGIQDTYMRARGIDYFENSRRATYVQREYAVRNPRKFLGYGENCWGVSASDGPGIRPFHGYRARGVPFGPDDGTIAPWAAAASLPFAPEIVLPALECMEQKVGCDMWNHPGTRSFNPTFEAGRDGSVWQSSYSFAIDQGPVVLMLENYRSGLIWNLLRRSPHIIRGLERAGFRPQLS